MDLRYSILRIVYSSHVALTIREICCILNNKPFNYCYNVDGNGGRCVWFYRRPRHEAQRIRLVKPECKVTALRVIQLVNTPVCERKLKKHVVHLRDPLSTWGHDNFRLVYIREEQLRNRLKTKNILDYLSE